MTNPRIFLENVHPALPWALVTVAVWGAVYATRRWAPKVWILLEAFGPEDAKAAKVFQALPSVLAGAVVGSYMMGSSYPEAWKGAAAGALAPLLHHVLKALPVPYTGKKGPP